MKAKTPITTTLKEIRKHKPCKGGWQKFLKYLGKTEADEEPLLLSTILDSNGLNDCLWSLRTRPDLDWLWRLYAVDCVREVQHSINDHRSIDALEVAEQYALGTASHEDLVAARKAAQNARRNVAWKAPWKAALDAAWDAALKAAWEAAAWNDALKAVRAKQERMLRHMLKNGERPNWKEAGDE